MPKSPISNKYRPPIVTVDFVGFTYFDKQLLVLLNKRSSEPFAQQLALPGGYVAEGETTSVALNRVLLEKSGFVAKQMAHIEQLYTFDTVGRDPRGHAVSVAYLGLTNYFDLANLTGSDQTQWCMASKPGKLAFDHNLIVDMAIKRLRSKLNYTNAAFALLPTLFTLSELQTLYETVFATAIDKRNFRKKIMATGLIEPTNKKTAGASHRPARYYRYKDTTIKEVQQFIRK